MNQSTRTPHDFMAIEKVSTRELRLLVEDARALQRSAQSGAAQPLLRGRKFGLLIAGGAECHIEIAFFSEATSKLGAQVAHLQAHLIEASTPREIDDAAHLLGRLYDALVCHGMNPAVVGRLGTAAGVPVFDDIVSTIEALERAAELVGTAGSSTDRRRFLLQALLISAVA